RRRAVWGRVTCSPEGSSTRCTPNGEWGVVAGICPPDRRFRRTSSVDTSHFRDDVRILPCMSVEIEQPYVYQRREIVEPDWSRFPGWREITADQWRDVQWQRVSCVKNIR